MTKFLFQDLSGSRTSPPTIYYIYLVTELDGITDNVTKIQRQKSATKYYYLINQNTEIKILILT